MNRKRRATDEAQHAAELLELGDAFFELDRSWRIVRVNRRQEALSRKSRAETVGRTFAEVWPELATPASRYWREYDRCMTERVPVQFHEYYAPLDLWTGVTAYPVSTGGIAVFFRDITAMKVAERERCRLASIVEDTDDAIISKNLEGVILTWNLGAERLFGYSADEVLGRPIRILLPQDRLDEEDRILADLRAGHRVDHYETRRVRKDGSLVDVSVTVSPLRDDAGEIIGASKIARDITRRKRTDRALRDTEERFRSVVENLSEGLMLFDAKGNLVHQNAASLRIHGFEPATDGRIERERLPVTWNAWDDQGRPIGFEQWPVSRVFRGERFQDQVLRVERVETGRVFYGSYNGSPILDADGNLVLGFITIRDITEQVRAEGALRDAERQYRSLAENAPEVIARFDLQLRHTYVNEYGAKVYGVPARDVIGKTNAELGMPPDKVEFWKRHFEAIVATGEQRTVEFDFDSPTFGKQFFSALFVPERDEAGDVVSILAITRDVTQRRRVEEALRLSQSRLEAEQARLQETDRRKDEFLGMLSHELRNPLAPIRNALYILDHAHPDGQQARRAKDVATRQVAHLTRLVDDLLDVTRIARGKIELRHEDVDLAGLARRTAEDYRALMQDRGLELAVDVPRAPVVVSGDPARLTQVLGNLLNNAAKFTPAGGRVTLAIGLDDGRAAVRVRDTGPGIARDVLPTIFEPFVQGKQTLARSEGGLGLGLSLVKGLVALHGGDVIALSEGAGHGTEFVVTLPLASRGARAGERASSTPAEAATHRRVLVVDDNKDAADTLAQLVDMLGHEVDVAYDGPEALAKARAHVPELVLCDIGLPGMDGYEVARRLRETGPSTVRLVALSGYAQPEDVARAIAAGFDAHVAKPPDPERLEQLLGASS